MDFFKMPLSRWGIHSIVGCFVLSLIIGEFQPLNAASPHHDWAYIENRGQWDETVLYQAQLQGLTAWVTSKGIVYDYYQNHSKKTKSANQSALQTTGVKQGDQVDEYYRVGHVVAMEFLQAEAQSTTTGEALAGAYNYFKGNDPNGWATNVQRYPEVTLQGLYRGVDLKLYFEDGAIRYDLVVEPYADVEQIAFGIRGSEDVKISDKGEVQYRTSLGEIAQGKLFAYQMVDGVQQQVECQFQLRNNNTIGFVATNYRKDLPLVIDPLVYSTFLGGNPTHLGNEVGLGIAVDANGKTYVTGYTTSNGFPTTLGAYDTSHNDGGTDEDIFVTKLTPDGSALIYSTFIGGSGPERGLDIAVDDANCAYIIGYTETSNYPTVNAFDNTYNQFRDAVVTKLNASGSSLVYSTYLGSDNFDQGSDIVLDQSRNAYVVGTTMQSTNNPPFPTTSGAFRQTNQGWNDAFLTKIAANGSSLVYSTFLGGSGSETGFGVAVNAKGEAFVCGATASAAPNDPIKFPTTLGAFQGTGNWTSLNGFLTKFTADGSNLVFSTFLRGGGALTEVLDVTVDDQDHAYVCGYTGSSHFPTTPDAFDRVHGGREEGFATKFNKDGRSVVYSTFLGDGSNSWVRANAITVDEDYRATVVGGVGRDPGTGAPIPVFPLTPDAPISTFLGNQMAFVTQLNGCGTGLSYSTYLGGLGSDGANDVTMRTSFSDNIYVTGGTHSADFPVTSGVYDNSYNLGADVFVTRLNPANYTDIHNILVITAMLEGPYNTGSLVMNHDLLTGNHLPLTDPYSGNTTVSVFPSTTTVDWVEVEIRTGHSDKGYSQVGFIRGDGQIVDAVGNQIQMHPSYSCDQPVFIIVRHRNHLDVMSPNPVALAGGVAYVHNFTPALTEAYNSPNITPDPMVEVSTGVWGLSTGDVNRDGQVNAVDRTMVTNALFQTGYLDEDVTLDGIVNTLDQVITLNNSFLRSHAP